MYKCPGTRLRPFSKSAGVACCSQPLQRAVVDFGADHAFGQVPDKLKEHYGITLPASTIRHITERHGQRILAHIIGKTPNARIERHVEFGFGAGYLRGELLLQGIARLS